MEILATSRTNSQHHLVTNERAATKKVVSSHFTQMLAAASTNEPEQSKQTEKPSVVFVMNTNHGNIEVDLDKHLNNKELAVGKASLSDVVLLLPSAHNIENLSKYSQEKLNELRAKYNIPEPPETIQFDGEGNLVLPENYAYKAQLKQAFEENPEVKNALQTTAALASHYAGIMEAQPYREEMATARSQADRDRIIAKYSYLFDDNRPAKQIVLSFLEDGKMLVGEKHSDNSTQLSNSR